MGDMVADQAGLYERVAISAPNRLVVSFRRKYTSCKTSCERPEQTAKLQAALEAVTGQKIGLSFELLDELLDGAPEAEATAQPTKRPASGADKLRQARQHPMVHKTVELFDAQIMRVDDDS